MKYSFASSTLLAAAHAFGSSSSDGFMGPVHASYGPDLYIPDCPDLGDLEHFDTAEY